MLKRNNKEVKHIYKGNYALPEEYQEVEYLESGYNTRQRIELPYKCNQNSNIDIGFLFNAKLRPVYEFVFECRTDVGKDSISVIKTNSNLFRYDFEKSSSRAGTKYVEANKLYTLKTNKNEFALYNNENIVEKIVVPSSTDFNSKNNINLYTNCSGQEFTTNHLRIYYCRITENDKLKIDSYPCYRKSDGVKGFYDLVSNTFCPNIDTISTEDFIAGPEVKKKVKKKVKFIIKDNRIIFADESLLPSE